VAAGAQQNLPDGTSGCYDELPVTEKEGNMKRQIGTAWCWAVFCSAILMWAASSSLALAQRKPAKACLEEWRANKASNQANGVTQKAYVAQCRAGAAALSSVKELMESIIDPSADVLWNAVQTVIDSEGVHDSFPKTVEEWLEVRHAVVRIIEGTNLLRMPGRDAAPAGTKSETPGVELEPPEISALIRKNRKQFDAFASALQVLGIEALRAADAKNVDLLSDVGGRMEPVCEGCHQMFWYPHEKRPTR
jgi:hypothetical protein